LRAELGDRICFEQPTGGMFVWAQLGGLDTRKLLPVAIEHGTAFVPGAEFAVDPTPASDALRLSFATAPADDLHEATRRLALAVRSVG
jgi:2-aminoadipate transaminase